MLKHYITNRGNGKRGKKWASTLPTELNHTKAGYSFRQYHVKEFWGHLKV